MCLKFPARAGRLCVKLDVCACAGLLRTVVCSAAIGRDKARQPRSDEGCGMDISSPLAGPTPSRAWGSRGSSTWGLPPRWPGPRKRPRETPSSPRSWSPEEAMRSASNALLICHFSIIVQNVYLDWKRLYNPLFLDDVDWFAGVSQYILKYLLNIISVILNSIILVYWYKYNDILIYH